MVQCFNELSFADIYGKATLADIIDIKDNLKQCYPTIK